MFIAIVLLLEGIDLFKKNKNIIMWLFGKKKDQDEYIKVGDCVTFRETFPNLDKYFIHGPLEVIRIDDGPDYAGGKFIICKYGYGEKGFYLNALKKVKCC